MDIYKKNQWWRSAEAIELRRARNILRQQTEEMLQKEPDYILPAVTLIACLFLAALILISGCPRTA